jgi:integrase
VVAVDKIRLTKSSVEKLPVPLAGEALVWDRDLAGFGVRLAPTGRRTYFVYGRTRAGRQVKLKVGIHGAITAERAREIATVELGKIAAGADPAAERSEAKTAEANRKAIPTVAQLCERYMVEYARAEKRPRSADGDQSMIDRLVKPRLGGQRVTQIDKAQVQALHRSLRKTPYQANRLLALLSKMFALAAGDWKLRDDNPVIGIKRFDEARRERYLDADELARLGDALRDHPHPVAAGAIRMLLLTGARKSEVLKMTWDEVEREPGTWVMPSAHNKNKRDFRVPLSPGALLVLDSMRRYRKPDDNHVFPGRAPGQPLVEIRKTWEAVLRVAGIDDVRLHDLRHTFASLLVGGGASLPMIGAILGHTQPATTARYAHLADGPLRTATTRVSEQIDGIASGRSAEVIALAKK